MDNIVPLHRKKPRSSDLVQGAVDRGQPLPLEVLLNNLHYWWSESQRLEPIDASLARIARHQAQRAAIEAAPYVHAKLSQQQISGDQEAPLEIQHVHRLSADELRGKSVKELGDIYLALAQSDKQRLAELLPLLPEAADA
jgi:hypothetical protein